MGHASIIGCDTMKSIVRRLYLNTRNAVLSATGFFFPRKHTVIRPEVLSKILFIRIDRIGDMVLSTPALKAIKETFPASELTVLASPSNAPVILHNPNVDHVIVFNTGKGSGEWLRTIRNLRACTFDVAVDPYNNYALKTALIAFLSGAAFRIGYESFGRGIFYHLAVEEIGNPHLVDIALDLLKPLSIEASNRKPEIFLSDEEKKQAQDWLAANDLGRRPIVGLHPGAFYPSQRWPSEYFSKLIEKIQIMDKHDILLFGGPCDEPIIRDIASRLKRKPPILVGSDLRRFASILSRCDMLICNNSGPLHIATALKIPTLSFMGPTVKERWMPIGTSHKVLRIDSLPCIGCDSGICLIKTHDCMHLLTPSMVINECNNMKWGRAGF